jgi:hypothetical protein
VLVISANVRYALVTFGSSLVTARLWQCRTSIMMVVGKLQTVPSEDALPTVC